MPMAPDPDLKTNCKCGNKLEGYYAQFYGECHSCERRRESETEWYSEMLHHA